MSADFSGMLFGPGHQYSPEALESVKKQLNENGLPVCDSNGNPIGKVIKSKISDNTLYVDFTIEKPLPWIPLIETGQVRASASGSVDRGPTPRVRDFKVRSFDLLPYPAFGFGHGGVRRKSPLEQLVDGVEDEQNKDDD